MTWDGDVEYPLPWWAATAGGLIIVGLLAAVVAGSREAKDRRYMQRIYRLHNGMEIECKVSLDRECGLELRECENGKIYRCQQNVEVR